MTKFFLLPDNLTFSGSRISSNYNTVAYQNTHHSLRTLEGAPVFGDIVPPMVNSDLEYDPLRTVKEWYGGTMEYRLDRYHSITYLYDFREVSDWINEHAREACYAKRDGNDWALLFVNQNDFFDFGSWMTKLSKNPFPNILPPKDMSKSEFTTLLQQWAKENIAGDYYLVPSWTANSIQFKCKDREDLVLIKLRWSEQFTK